VKNVQILFKFLSVMAIFGVFAIAVAVYSTSQMRKIDNSYSALMEGNDAATLDAARASRYLEAMRSAMAVTQIATDAATLARLKAEFDNSVAAYADLLNKAAAAAPDHAAAFNAIQANGLNVVNNECAKSYQDGYAATNDAQTLAAQKEYLSDCEPNFPPVIKAIADLNDQLATETSSADDGLTSVTDNTIMITYGAIIGGLVLVMSIGFFGIRAWVVGPIAALQHVMGRLAGGDLKTEVNGVDRRDEIGGMARAVQVFKDAGVEKERVEAEATRMREMAEAERKTAEAEREAVAQQQQVVTTALASGLEKLSAGDLLYRINSVFGGEYEKLRHDFNDALDKLQEAMRGIATNTMGVKSGATEITSASDDLSRRTEQQAASLEETAAALDQITATVRKSAEAAAEARSLAAEAKIDAEKSGEVVSDTVNAMSGIETSSKQIGNIIGVIDEIAFQTNLLALNAGVEAARAGDAGRGFAVVATEVRALAQRSAEAAKEIKSLISASSTQVESGVKLVGRTGQALERIVGQIAKLNGLVSDIAASAHEQASGLSQVNTAVNQMDQVTQQNAAMVEQATAASHNMAREAQELARLVGNFQIGDTQASKIPLKTDKPGRASLALAPHHTGAQKPAPAKPVVPLKLVQTATAALAGASAEEWSEF
jgi:methyl-accepting chemotaxis protein